MLGGGFRSWIDLTELFKVLRIGRWCALGVNYLTVGFLSLVPPRRGNLYGLCPYHDLSWLLVLLLLFLVSFSSWRTETLFLPRDVVGGCGGWAAVVSPSLCCFSLVLSSQYSEERVSLNTNLGQSLLSYTVYIVDFWLYQTFLCPYSLHCVNIVSRCCFDCSLHYH